MTHIVLTGFMAVGKTAVGKRLARRLKRKFFDTDALIEEREATTVGEIFANRGEEEFRRIEREVVADLCPQQPAVIATGGGTFVDEDNRRRLRALGIVVCLTTSLDTVLERVERNTKRPLAKGAPARETLGELLERRMVAYRQADVMIETDSLTIEQAAARVLSMVEPRLKLEGCDRGRSDPE